MKKTVMREKREWGFEGLREIWIVKSCVYIYKGVPLILAQHLTNASVTN